MAVRHDDVHSDPILPSYTEVLTRARRRIERGSLSDPYADVTRRAYVWIAVVTVLRVFGAATWGLENTEAYYASWARHPALSYYDHPGLTAWIVRLTTAFGASPLSARLGPLVAATATLLLTHAWTRRLFSPRAALWAVGLLSLIPTYFFVGFTLNPEAVVLPFLLVGWMALDRMRASTTTPDGARWALLLGGAIGVGFLAKYTAVLMVPIALAYLATGADTRGWFKRPSLYVAGLFALALATPVIVWNAQHHWPTLTLHLVERTARPSLAVYLSNAKTTAISQLLVTQPLMLAIALFGAGYALHRARRDGRYRLLAWAALPSWLFFLVMMVRVRDAEPHWTMSAYLPMVVAAAGAIDEWRAPSMLARRWTRRLVTAAAATSFAVYALAFVHGASPWLTERLPVASHDADPFNESAGWEVNAPALLERARALGPEAPIVGSHNVLCGQLDWQLGAAIEVDCASPRRTAYDFFGRRDPSPSAPALYVDSLRYPEDPAKLLPHHRCGEFSTLTVQRGETEVGTLRLARCLPVSGS